MANIDPGFGAVAPGMGRANFGRDNIPSIDPGFSGAGGNLQRKQALLQLLMQRAQQAQAGGIGGGFGRQRGVSGASGSVPFGGMRATPKARDASGQSFTRPGQVAAAFVGGLGVGARPGQSQAGSNGEAVQRFLPTDGGPVQRHVGGGPPAPHALPQAPPAPEAPVQAIDAGPVDAPADAPFASGAWADPAAAPGAPQVGVDEQGIPLYQGPNNPIPTVDPGFDMYKPGNTPTTGASSLIPLGNGAYLDPATGAIHFPKTRTTAA